MRPDIALAVGAFVAVFEVAWGGGRTSVLLLAAALLGVKMQR